MDNLKKQLAPISDGAWQEIDQEARRVFALNLSARRIVEVSEPLGLDVASVDTGRLDEPQSEPVEGVRLGIRRSLPLVEARADFELARAELDAVDRGAQDPDLEALDRAAVELARFEERVLYEGLDEVGITGLVGASGLEPVTVADGPSGLPEAVSQAVLKLRYAGVDGPYALALGAALYRTLQAASEQGYPIRRWVAELIGGEIVLAPYLEGGVVVSQRGGDAEMTLGQDLSIGYSHHDGDTVGLYFRESFTFRVLTPEAVVALRAEVVG